MVNMDINAVRYIGKRVMAAVTTNCLITGDLQWNGRGNFFVVEFRKLSGEHARVTFNQSDVKLVVMNKDQIIIYLY